MPHCPNCGRAITRQSTEQIVQAVLSGELAARGDRIMILAPIVRGRKGEYRAGTREIGARRIHPRAHRRHALSAGRSAAASTAAKITPSKWSWIACW